jgi:uncharacterized membrane protein HdeD (DUF308 family)
LFAEAIYRNEEVATLKRFWWFNIIRGAVAIIIGMLIFAWPDASAKTLVNFMGVYWLSSGLMSLRWGVAVRKDKGLWIAAGMIGAIGGIAILFRPFYTSYFPPGLPLTIFGIIAFLTGLIHIFGGFRTATLSRIHTWGSELLGLLEVALGVLLLTATALEPFTKLVAGSWACVGGILLIIQALYLRRALRVNIEPAQETAL